MTTSTIRAGGQQSVRLALVFAAVAVVLAVAALITSVLGLHGTAATPHGKLTKNPAVSTPGGDGGSDVTNLKHVRGGRVALG